MSQKCKMLHVALSSKIKNYIDCIENVSSVNRSVNIPDLSFIDIGASLLTDDR